MIFAISIILSGYAVFAYLIFLLGIAGLITLPWTLLALALSIVIAVMLAKKTPNAIKHFANGDLSTPKVRLRLTMGAILIMLPLLHVMLIPPYLVDDLAYHLYVPEQMARTGHLYLSTFNLNSNYPMLFEFPLVIFELLRQNEIPLLGQLSPFIINWLVLLAIGCVLFEIGRQQLRLQPWVLFAALVALVTTPVVYDLLRSTYVELFLSLVSILALAYYLRWHSRSEASSANARCFWYGSAVFLGMACATKYTGFFLAGPIILIEFRTKQSKPIFYTGLALMIMAMCPWYVKNMILTGNPTFPMLDSFLGSDFEPEILTTVRGIYFHSILKAYSYGWSGLDYLKLPVRLITGYETEISPGHLGFGGQLSFFFVLAVIGLGWRDLNRRLVAGLFLIFLLVWATTSQQVRFLLPYTLLPILYGVQQLTETKRHQRWWQAVFIALVGATLIQNTVHLTQLMRREKIMTLLSGEMTRDEFLTAHLPVSYGFAQQVNALVDPKKHRILSIGNFGRSYYFTADVLTNTYYDAEIFDVAFDKEHPNESRLTDFLKRESLTHLMIDWGFYLASQNQGEGSADVPALKRYIETHTRLVANQGNVELRELVQPSH